MLAIDGECSKQHIILAKCDYESASSATQIDYCAAKRITLTVRVFIQLIQIVNEFLTCKQSPVCVSRPGLVHSVTEIGGKSVRHASLRGAFKAFPIIRGHESECGLAKMQCVVEYRDEHRCEIASRGVDDPQDSLAATC